MNKKILKIFCLLISMTFVLPISAVIAAKPNVDDAVWFTAAVLNPTPTAIGKSWLTGKDTIIHMKGRARNLGVFRSPPGSPGTVLIGSMSTMVETFVFNTKTSEGQLIIKVTISLTETDSTKNPYGVGTLEGTLIAKVTNLHPLMADSPGNATGFIVATHGSGAFEKAKLTADVVMWAFGPPTPGRFIFFGTHENVNGRGIIVYH